ncbi:MAG: cytochrome c1, partial [Pseudomonadota bacterium]
MKFFVTAILLLLAPALWANEGVHLDKANVNLHDQAALQRGAKHFFGYCSGCHALKYARYERIGKDIGLSPDEVKKSLMPAGSKIVDLVTNPMLPEDAEKWFGTPVPDLTLAARLRGEDWIYSFLRSFYQDPKKVMGVNNRIFPDVAMPHVLVDLQGLQKAVYHEEKGEAGHAAKTFEKFEKVAPGTLTTEQYDQMVKDIVTFLTYVSEPIKLERQALGLNVLIFLLIFSVLAY